MRRKKPTIISYGLLEHAANACGFSFVEMMPKKTRKKTERGLRHLKKTVPGGGF